MRPAGGALPVGLLGRNAQNAPVSRVAAVVGTVPQIPQVAVPRATSYWVYRWCAGDQKDKTFGPFDNNMMQMWQSQNLFAAHPAEAVQCDESGNPKIFLGESGPNWRQADMVDFS